MAGKHVAERRKLGGYLTGPKRWAFAVAALVFLGIAQGAPAELKTADKAFLAPEDVYQVWNAQYATLDTFRYEFHHSLLKDAFPNPEAAKKHVEHMHERVIRSGLRYYVLDSLAEDGFKNPRAVNQWSFDGEHSMSYTPLDGTAEIYGGMRNWAAAHDSLANSLRTWRGSPSDLPHLANLYRIYKRIGALKILPELDTVSGERCHVLQMGPSREGWVRKVWFAHDKGMLVMKEESLRNGDLRTRFVVDAVAVSKRGENPFYYPSRARRWSFRDGESEYGYQVEIHGLELDFPVTDDMFRVRFPEGVSIYDDTLRTSYVTGGDNERLAGRETFVTLALNDVTLRQALNMMLRPRGLDFAILNDAIFISTKEEIRKIAP